MQNKFFRFLSVILILILIIEAFYLYSQFNRSKGNESILDNNKIGQTIKPTPGSYTNRDTFNNISQFIDLGLIEKSSFVNEYQGEVIRLHNTDIDGALDGKYARAKLLIQIKKADSQSKYATPVFFFTVNELGNLIIQEKLGEEVEEAQWNDLELGQTVAIEETWDLIEEAITNYKITIL